MLTTVFYEVVKFKVHGAGQQIRPSGHLHTVENLKGAVQNDFFQTRGNQSYSWKVAPSPQESFNHLVKLQKPGISTRLLVLDSNIKCQMVDLPQNNNGEPGSSKDYTLDYIMEPM